MKRIFVGILFSLVSVHAFAVEEQLNEVLVRIISQIDAISPLLDEAQKEVSTNSRVTLHINSFKDANGQQHPGLRDDLTSIKRALIEYINQPVIAPRIITPLPLDFIEKRHATS